MAPELPREAAQGPDPARDAAQIAALFALDPFGLGGVVLRGFAGPVRNAWLDMLKAMLPDGAVWKRLPHGIADDRLLGGLDLTTSLRLGKPALQKGVLAEADGGTLVISMAERLPSMTAARIVSAMDRGAISIAREGFSSEHAARFGVIALDEGIDADEQPPSALLDRLAFRIPLDRIGRSAMSPLHRQADITAARDRLSAIVPQDHLIEALCGAAFAFGISSFRAVQFALNAARAAAALAGRTSIGDEDAALAARLVFAPRATQLPAAKDEEDQNDPAAEPQGEVERGPDAGLSGDDRPEPQADDAVPDQPLADIVQTAVQASLPAALLASLAAGAAAAGGRGEGRSDGTRKSALRGRPIGSMRGDLRAGARLALLDTLRAAAPWQKVRRRLHGEAKAARILVRADDFRIMRFKQKTRTTTIFVVDASGSAALHRLGEAKGAVELLLADCYVRRDEVALIAFRGKTAEILLPPTRSLARAKRSLAGLPGGGGTPLAAGLRAAHDLALATARRGDRPVLVFLTDGQANIALDGRGSRASAGSDASLAARALRLARVPTVLIDTSARPQPKAAKLAEEMGARYLAMPSADLRQVSNAVSSV